MSSLQRELQRAEGPAGMRGSILSWFAQRLIDLGAAVPALHSGARLRVD